ncbi:MAG: type IX secretion system sortase PorU [Chitinophagaceae bacterium]
MLKACHLCFLLLVVIGLAGQRSYRASSVLSSGAWYQIAVKEPGVYKIDLALLTSIGLNASNVTSSSIRLFGNGGQVLPENCSARVPDDLEENAIEVIDGGDGVFNGQDYILFYASGPDDWYNDSLNKRFIHRKNIYNNQSFYFITLGGAGKRAQELTHTSVPSKTVTSFNERYFHELDSINFLSSGKDWFGEEFSNSPGKASNQVFATPLTNLVPNTQATLVSDCIARSIGISSRFSVSVNNVGLLQHDIAAVTSGNTDLFAHSSQVANNFTVASSIAISYTYQPQVIGAQGWLNWFEVFARKNLSMSGVSQLLFRDWNSVERGASSEFLLKNASTATTVWDITDRINPLKIKTSLIASDVRFSNDCSTLHEYIAFGNTGFLNPSAIGKIENQDLHGSPTAELLIITFPGILTEARRLADFHRQHDQMKVSVFTTAQIFNEFSSGSPDPTAIRNFVKMYYDKAGQDTSRSPRYLLLFGDASYDYKNRLKNNSNLVPAYISNLSLDPLATFTSDDYFGFLDDDEDISALHAKNSLDIGIGRVPAKTAAEAAAYVDKVISYHAKESLGAWRNRLTFIADDEDNNLHFHDAEVITGTAKATNPVFIEDKLYLDAFVQESNASGSRYPAVNQAINGNINNGTLIWNYSGHGGYSRLAEEVVLDKDIIQSWNNSFKLPLFITATCDFAPYDNPAINSLGEDILLKQQTGAIALMTTTRLVFAYSNRVMNRNYLHTALKRKADGSYMSLGAAVKTAKNTTFQSQGDNINNLKFTLLGDPALTLNFPLYNIQTTTINAIPVTGTPDTLKALQHYTVGGAVTDWTGTLLTNFNGNLFVTVFDKVQQATTRGNDPGSVAEKFDVQNSILFKGRAVVKNGLFSFGFIVPKDINYQPGSGKISYYAENGTQDANGSFTGFIIGGSQGISTDLKGPEIKAFLNDESFINGSETGINPLLLVKLNDSSGINITGSSIGHDILAVLDGDPKKTFNLNSYYEADSNSYQKGTIKFRLPILEKGNHTLMVKAWDVANNSNEVTIHFIVSESQRLEVLNVSVFPNPFSSKTTFRIAHDLDAQNIRVVVQLYTLSGRLVKSIQQTINTNGSRSSDIEWDGKNDNGSLVQSGLYAYILQVETGKGITTRRAGKIVKLF